MQGEWDIFLYVHKSAQDYMVSSCDHSGHNPSLCEDVMMKFWESSLELHGWMQQNIVLATDKFMQTAQF